MNDNQPNILIIMSDQHHAKIMGCAGDPIVQTPNLDRLALEGVRFSNAYCSSPLCCPSRMSFLTGQHPHEIEVWDNRNELRSDIPTFAHAFSAAGYDTVLSGRMHFVGGDQRHGFAERIISDVTTTAYINRGWQLEKVLGPLVDTPGMSLNGIIKSGPGQTAYQAYDKAVTKTTVDWLNKRNHSNNPPFLLTVGYVTPHCPFVSPPDDFEIYQNKILSCDLPVEDNNLHPRNVALRNVNGIDPAPPIDAQWRTRVAYYGLTTFLDRQVGAILDALEATGQDENTVIVYCSDHGESLGEHGLWWKSTFYDASCAVPLIISYPGQIDKNKLFDNNVSLMDVGPTLIDLAGVGPLPGTSGRSFQELLIGKDDEWDDTVFAEFASDVTCRMVRSGQWKYNYYYGMPPELFNIENDPNELHNLIGQSDYKEIEQHLNELVLRDWDPKHVQNKREQTQLQRPLIADWIRTTKPPEPDLPWFDKTPKNSVNNSLHPPPDA